MLKTRAIAALAILTAFALPATAVAGLPRTSSDLIVVNKSIGGVALGAKSSSVIAAWGATKECETTCHYEGAEPANGTPDFGNVQLESATGKPPYKVWQITIALATSEAGAKPKPIFNSPLMSFKTSKGIGLGSTEAELKAAYHGLKKVSASAVYTEYELPGPKESATFFSLQSSKKVTTITLESHPGG